MRLVRLAASLALAGVLGCAAAGLTPVAPNQPVARAALLPEYRVFYDALRDCGDWVLIEPFGFVFRPRVAWNQWQPFEDGFWAPTDAFGWVWISAEPFGWATYHYGDWFFDRYQGWVWLPGLDWSPGWANWEIAGDYVGWGPLARNGATSSANAAAAMHYAPLAQLGATDLKSRLVTREQIGATLRDAHPVRNFVQRQGVSFNRGPSLDLVEQLAGPLSRARIEDLVPVDLGRRVAGRPSYDPSGTRRESAAGEARDPAAAAADADAIGLTQRAAERAAAEARQLMRVPRANPQSLPVVRPIFDARDGADSTGSARRRGPPRPPRRENAAPADTTR